MLDSAQIQQKYLKHIGGQKEWLISKRNHIQIVINKFSWDEFVLSEIPNNIDGKKLEDFKTRQLYSLPNTPKILLLNNQENPNQPKLLLCQKAPYNFEKLMRWHSEYNDIVKLFMKIINVIEMLTKKYGYFDITEEMIGASKGPTPIVWIHQNQIQGEPEFPIKQGKSRSGRSNQDELQLYIILKLANLFQKHHSTINLGLKEKNQSWSFNSVYEYLQKKIKNSVSSNFLVLSSKNLAFLNKDRPKATKKNSSIPEFLKKDSSNKQSNITCKYKNSYPISAPPQKNLIPFCKIKPRAEKKQKIYPGYALINKNQLNYSNTPKAKNQTFKFPTPVAYSKERIQIDDDSRKEPNIKLNCDSILSYESYSHQEIKGFFRSDKSIEVSLEKDRKLSCVCQMRNTISNNTFISKLKNEQKRIGCFGSCRTDTHKIELKNNKGKIRDSGRSISTTTAQYFSITSSGNRKQMSMEEEMGNSFSQKRQKLVSTFGTKTSTPQQDQNRKQFKDRIKRSDKFAVKVSKIIQENEEMLAQSPSRRSPKSPSIICGKNLNQNSLFQGSQFQKEVSNLFCSGVFEPEPQEISGIEQELDNLLF